jgi:hypothetical protein
VGTEGIFSHLAWYIRKSLAAIQGAFNVPLKCTPEEYKHFVEPAMAEADKSNFSGAIDVVTNGLDAHPASEGLLFLKAYFGYKLADTMSNELSTLPKAIQPMGEGLLMMDGGVTNKMLGRFEEIVKVLGEAETTIDELLQINPGNKEVLGFKSYIDQKLQRLGHESENMRTTFNNSPNIAGGYCVGCKKNISFESQTVVFRRTSVSQMEVWHLPCFQRLKTN